jgi:hypothetical protein
MVMQLTKSTTDRSLNGSSELGLRESTRTNKADVIVVGSGDAAYLVRPDGYVALAAARSDASAKLKNLRRKAQAHIWRPDLVIIDLKAREWPP